jgi:hypothetical protein
VDQSILLVTPFGVTQLKDVSTVTTSANAVILPSSNYNGTASPHHAYWIWKPPASSNTNWVYVGAGSTLNPGEGFTMKGTQYNNRCRRSK